MHLPAAGARDRLYLKIAQQLDLARHNSLPLLANEVIK